MQNKPNLLNAQMNVSSVLAKDYEQITMNNEPEKQTQSNPIKANFISPKLLPYILSAVVYTKAEAHSAAEGWRRRIQT